MSPVNFGERPSLDRCVVIPRNFCELGDHERQGIIPICMPRYLADGSEIPAGWFDLGVEPASHTLRRLARTHLGDEWRVSELAEQVVCPLAARHGEDVGHNPKRRIIVRAVWEVKNIAAGSRSERWHRFQTHRLTSLPRVGSIREDSVGGESFAKRCYRDILLDTIYERLGKDAQIQRVFSLMAAGCSWDEVGEEMGGVEITEVWRKRFWRLVRNVSGSSAKA